MDVRDMKRKTKKCPKCGYEFKEISEETAIKTWHLVSPLPDKQGRITVTLMGTWKCPQCGYTIRGVISKIKVGEETRTVNRTQMLIDILRNSERITIKDIADKFNMEESTIEKAIMYLIKKGKIKGQIMNGVFIREN